MINLPLQPYQEKFAAAESLNDFLAGLKKCEEIIEVFSGQKPMDYKSQSFGFLLANKDKLYYEFKIRKKSGGYRVINAPNSQLAFIQRRIKTILTLFYNSPYKWFEDKNWESIYSSLFQPTTNTHGFLYDRSIVTNASQHVGKDYVLNLDLKDFFPSIGVGKIIKSLQTEPFNFNYYTAQIIANLCTLNGFLPQGSPASPILSNIVSRRLDYHINSICKDLPTTIYTRYVDDITFSCDYNLFDSAFVSKIEQLILDEGFFVNIKKTRLQTATQRQEVTGLIVNEKLNVPRKKIKLLRSMLWNWKCHGYEAAQLKFQNKEKSKSELSKVIWGHLCFIKMVRGENDIVYNKYLAEFNKLQHGN
jgi:retron-type reverse transcriptase